MNALSALMPTHAMFAAAAAAGAQPRRASAPPCEHSQSVADPIRKYVIVQDPITATELPIVFPNSIQHSTVVPRGMIPVSAGFIMLFPSGVQLLERFGSESLNLNPRPQDREILTAFLQ